jgi:hypothetical protein
MHVTTGQIISPAEFLVLPVSARTDYVQIDGTPEQVERLSRATAHYSAVTGVDRSKRRAANKAARKARRNNRSR